MAKKILHTLFKSHDWAWTPEQLPFNSTVPNHKWFLTKDKYGLFYFIFVDQDIFEEKFVFKLQRKCENTIDYFQNHLDDPDKMQELRRKLKNHIKEFNNAISKDKYNAD